MTNSRKIQPRQITAIELDAAAQGFTNPQDAVDAVGGIVSRNWRYDLDTMQASAVITALRSGLVPEVRPTAAEAQQGAMPPADVIAALGRRVQLHTRSASGAVGEWVGVADAVVLSDKDGTPALRIHGDSGGWPVVRLSLVTAWALL
jgi:hypothetical protein